MGHKLFPSSSRRASGGSTYRLRLRSACSVANKRLSVEFDARCKGPPGQQLWRIRGPKRTHNEVGDLWLGREIFVKFLFLGGGSGVFFLFFSFGVGGRFARQIMRGCWDDGDGDGDGDGETDAAGEGDGNDQVISSWSWRWWWTATTNRPPKKTPAADLC